MGGKRGRGGGEEGRGGGEGGGMTEDWDGFRPIDDIAVPTTQTTQTEREKKAGQEKARS